MPRQLSPTQSRMPKQLSPTSSAKKTIATPLKIKEREEVKVSQVVRSEMPSPGTTSAARGSSPIKETMASNGTMQESEIRMQPSHKEKRKQEIQSMLVNFEKENKEVMAEHVLCTGTRAKAIQAIDKWFKTKEKDGNFQRTMAVTGGVGMGKTCLASEICKRYKDSLAGQHFFNYTQPNLDLNQAEYVIQSVVYQMCTAFPNFASVLPQKDKLTALLTSSVGDLFNSLVCQPLFADGLNHEEDRHMLVVIDALDECDQETQRHILELVNAFNEATPDWMFLLITLRNENQLLSQCPNLQAFELKNSPDNLMDIKRFLKEPMSPYMDRISLDGGLTQLAKKTQGSFLCAHFFRKILQDMGPNRKIALREIEVLFPTGVTGVYQKTYRSLKEYLCQSLSQPMAEQMYQEILGMLIHAREPVHQSYLEEVGITDQHSLLNCILVLLRVDMECIRFHHRQSAEWLLNEADAGEYAVKHGPSRQKVAELCTKWLNSVVGETAGNDTHRQLRQYAVKHGVYHLLDVSKQQDMIAKVLCSLQYIQEKLKLASCRLRHLSGDYNHSHQQAFLEQPKTVNISDYMKKQPQHMEQIKMYHKFIKQRGQDLEESSDFTLHVAANYANGERIKTNARCELERRPWLQDLTSLPDTPGGKMSFKGDIVAVGASSDGANVAVVTKDEDYTLLLYIVNVATCEQRVEPIDIKNLKDRVGVFATFMPDNTTIFVGSLTSFINVRGKVVNSGFEEKSVQLKEKFSIECCDVGRRFLVCGLTTFPWGGRSLHMTAFEVKSKKCTKTVELLKFRFGGSAQFGVRCCSLSHDESMVCTVVKESTKAVVKATIWSTSKWNAITSVDIESDLVSRCIFFGDSQIIFGSGSKSELGTSPDMSTKMKSVIWKPKSGLPPEALDEREVCSVFSTCGPGLAVLRWFATHGYVSMSVWSNPDFGKPVIKDCPVRGADEISDLALTTRHVIAVQNSELTTFNIEELRRYLPGEGADRIEGQMFESVTFLPKVEEGIAVHRKPWESATKIGTVSRMTVQAEEAVLKDSLLTEEDICASAMSRGCFPAQRSTLDICNSNQDGSVLSFNTGEGVKILNRSSGSSYMLPTYAEIANKERPEHHKKPILCTLSSKDNIAGLVYPQIPFRIHLFDLPSKRLLRKLELPGANVDVSDFAFHPSTGYVLSHHQDGDRTLAVWNQRSGALVSQTHNLPLAYAKMSPASDRMVISLGFDMGEEGDLLLRNSDAKFSNYLIRDSWPSAPGDSDVDFSSDGTTLISVSQVINHCAVWNAGNGELLKQLGVWFRGPAEIVGMPTNTHVIFYDSRLVVVDVGSGSTVALLPLQDKLERRGSRKALRVSAKGNFIMGANHIGQLRVFQCNNFEIVKRKTTLQRLKSYTPQ